MNKEIYRRVKEFKRKYPMTIAFRLRAHAKVASKFIGSDEEIKYVFVAQKNYQSYEIINTNIIAKVTRTQFASFLFFFFKYDKK